MTPSQGKFYYTSPSRFVKLDSSNRLFPSLLTVGKPCSTAAAQLGRFARTANIHSELAAKWHAHKRHRQKEANHVHMGAMGTLTGERSEPKKFWKRLINGAASRGFRPDPSQKLRSDVFRCRFRVPENVCLNRSIDCASHAKNRTGLIVGAQR